MTSHIINRLKYNLKIALSVYQNNHRLVQINYILNPASIEFAKDNRRTTRLQVLANTADCPCSTRPSPPFGRVPGFGKIGTTLGNPFSKTATFMAVFKAICVM